MAERPPCDPKTIAPLNKDGFPDLVGYMPTRFVPLDEAKDRGWPTFYEGAICRYGHQAPRFTSNPRRCIDCVRIKSGRQPIGASRQVGEWKAPPRKQREDPPALPVVATPVTAPEPDRLEKKFLEAYAATKDFAAAAQVCGTPAPHVQARIAWSSVFRTALNELEDRLMIKRTLPPPVDFVWTEEKRERLITVLVDTGDIATARDAIGCTPSQYYKEYESNSEYASSIDSAQELADKSLEERAVQLALAGNDKLLIKVLSAKMPKYRENLKIDMNVTEKNLSADQLRAEIVRLFRAGHGRTVDAEFAEVVAGGTTEALPNPERIESAREPESNLDLL